MKQPRFLSPSITLAFALLTAMGFASGRARRQCAKHLELEYEAGRDE
jgi:hypothetical protein